MPAAARRAPTATACPTDPELEGAHYIRPGPGYRQAVAHGLFGALAVEPEGSTYLHPDTGQPLRSGWEAMIKPGSGKAAFREYVKVYHEIGDEKTHVFGRRRPRRCRRVDPITEAYRPGSRAINYRSEPFMHRLERAERQEVARPTTRTRSATRRRRCMRAYSADPTKIRIIHAGAEMFHVYHLHGGGIRWPQNPHADPTCDYAKTRACNKNPRLGGTEPPRLAVLRPGRVLHAGDRGRRRRRPAARVGDLLEHCHIAEHYVAGMWSFWRVYNTRQADLEPLPDRAAPPGGGRLAPA